MLVPDYWAEARLKKRTSKRQVTVRRFGWSDESPTAAQTHADSRAEQALSRILRGENLERREPKLAYNGVEGVPIREEVLERISREVITRNSYGAHCLNTPRVLFADIDFSHTVKFGARNLALPLGIITTLIALYMGVTPSLACGAGFFNWVIFWMFTSPSGKRLEAEQMNEAQKNKARENARKLLEEYLKKKPTWGLRVYDTPNGLRILVTHATFQPRSDEVKEFFEYIQADPLYVQMCQRQNCFRARLTPKPWRMGVGENMKPRAGTGASVWPVTGHRLTERKRWVSEYERQRKSYAACRFAYELGKALPNRDVRRVIEIHDKRSNAQSELPLA